MQFFPVIIFPVVYYAFESRAAGPVIKMFKLRSVSRKKLSETLTLINRQICANTHFIFLLVTFLDILVLLDVI